MTDFAELLAIGDEIVHGALLDTNSRAITRELEQHGIPVRRFTVVSDDPLDIETAIRDACARARIVVATGGLGPTLDDRTRDAAAAAGAVPLEFDEPAWQQVQQWFLRFRRPVPESNRRQAFVPQGAEVLCNRAGTAPGFRQRIGGCDLFVLPGVPREMTAMLHEHVVPFVRALPGVRPTAQHYLRVVGPSEALLGQRIEPFMLPGRNPAVGITAHYGLLTIRIVATAPTTAAAAAGCAATAAELRPLLGDWLLAEGLDDLPALVLARLAAHGATLAVAESCTGGLLCAQLTDLPGSSQVLRGGDVTYSNDAKVRLGVPRELIDAHGAVSEPVVQAMADAVRRVHGARLGLAISGIAGPDGGSPSKPVGTVCFALSTPDGGRAWTLRIADLGRQFIRERAATEAWGALLRTPLAPLPEAPAGG